MFIFINDIFLEHIYDELLHNEHCSPIVSIFRILALENETHGKYKNDKRKLQNKRTNYRR